LQPPATQRRKRSGPRRLPGLMPAAVAAIVLAFGLTGHAVWELWHVYASVKSISQRVERVRAQLGRSEGPDMREVQSELWSLAADAEAARASLRRLPWLRLLPLVSGWQRSAEQLLAAGRLTALGGAELAAALSPYQEAILRGGDGRGRLQALAEALRASRPQLDRAATLWEKAAEEARGIDVDALPSSLFGVRVRATGREALSAIRHAGTAAPWLPYLPSLLGADGPRRYLLLFQDSGEVRATGGFLAAFAHLEVANGVIALTPSQDIFDLPRYGCERSPLPEEAVQLLEGAGGDAGTFSILISHFWRAGIPIQDSNWWPDLRRSMGLFLCHYAASGMPPVDGVVLLDMAFLVGLLEETGPVRVAGYPEPFSSDPITYLGAPVPQAVFQILLYAERLHVGEPDRKRVVGDLGRAILERLYEMPGPSFWRTGGRLLRLAREGHLLVYFPAANLQRLVEQSPLGGKVGAPSDSDYLYLVEANYAGCKCDLFVRREVYQQAVAQGGSIRRAVTLKYDNPVAPDGWLVKRAEGTYVVRAYVPRGARLLSSSGHAGMPVTYQDGEATVFAFLVRLPAPGSVQLTFVYELPDQLGRHLLQKGYTLVLQRQPGLPPLRHVLNIMGTEVDVTLGEISPVRVDRPP